MVYASIEKSITVNVITAGTLSTFLDPSQKLQITELTISGNLNGSDFYTIRDLTNLSLLNLADANIVSGGGTYYPIPSFNWFTSNNEVSQYLFSNLSNITSIKLPKNIVSIREGAFYGCGKLKSIEIPGSVKAIERYAFYYCTGLDSIVITDNVTSIGDNAFGICSALRSIYLPKSLLTIGEDIFYSCTGLKEIHCQSIVPPMVNSLSINTLTKSNCTLFVPVGALSTYQSALVWREFTKMTDGIISSSVNQKFEDIHVISDHKSIIVSGSRFGDVVQVYSISGTLIHSERVYMDNFRIELPENNLYIVKVENVNFKIAINNR